MNTTHPKERRSFVRIGTLALLTLAGVVALRISTSARPQNPPPPVPTTIYVDVNVAPGGAHDGSTWANAFISLDQAIAAALPTGELWIAQGTYKPASQVSGFLIAKSLKLYGGFLGPHDPTDPSYPGEALLQDRRGSFLATILEGDIASNDPASYDDNARHLLKIDGSAEDIRVVVDGFKIQHGYCLGFTSNPPLPANDGAGIWCSGANLDVANCTFEQDWARNGGGIWFSGTSAQPPAQTAYVGDTLTVKLSDFVDDHAEINGGGIFAEKIYAGWVVNTRFLSNRTTQKGGGVYLRQVKQEQSFDFTNCVFWENWDAFHAGGALYMDEVTPATSDATTSSVVNCTFAGNFSSTGLDGQAVFVSAHSPGSIYNSILYWNYELETGFYAGMNPISGNATVDYSDVKWGWNPAGNNIDSNPLFVGGSPPLHSTTPLDLPPLLTVRKSTATVHGSDCIDHADYGRLPPDWADLNFNGNTTEKTPADLLDSRRFVDRLDFGEEPDLGAPLPNEGYLDMGAYERPL